LRFGAPETLSAIPGGKDRVLCDLAAEVLSVSGHLVVRVLGGSMLPSVRPGDELTIHRAGIADVGPGDLVLYSRDGGFVIHRVIGCSAEGLLTRGDALCADDPPVLPAQVLGKVVVIRRLRAEFSPAASMNRAQEALGFLMRRYAPLRILFLGIHSIRIKVNRLLRNQARDRVSA